MKCPKCKVELECPCGNCAVNFPQYKDSPKWIWFNGDYIRCPKCGHKDHCDNWEDEYSKEEPK